MKRRVAAGYLVAVHMLLVVVLLKSDFIDRVQARIDFEHTGLPPEITEQFHWMLPYHMRMDDNVPDGAVIFIGDSITQGLCVSAVASPAVNYGIGGDTTVGVLKRLPEYDSLHRASAVVMAIGINDMRRRPDSEILDNYRAIIERVPKGTPIVVSAILPLDEDSKQQWRGWNRDRIKGLNSSLAELAAADPRIVFADAGPMLLDASGNLADQYHDGDGIHLNAAGNAVWIDALQIGLTKVKHPELRRRSKTGRDR